MASSCSVKAVCPSTTLTKASVFPMLSSVLPMMDDERKVNKAIVSRGCIVCSAVQESSTSTASAKAKESKAAADKEDAVKPKPAAGKAPAKPLPELMEDDVIPSLRSTLETQSDLTDLDLAFRDNRLEGSFQKDGNSYSFWAFFPNGVLTGPKGFALSSNGIGASTVEPFLIDEKKITANHVVFWVEKRLAAQGILPAYKE